MLRLICHFILPSTQILILCLLLAAQYSSAIKVTCYRCFNETDISLCHRKAVICYGVCYSHNISAPGGVLLYSKGCDINCYGPEDYPHAEGLKGRPAVTACCDSDFCNGDTPRGESMSLTEAMATAGAVVFVAITLTVLGAGIMKRSRFIQQRNQVRREQVRLPATYNNGAFDPDFRHVPDAPPYEQVDKTPLPSYEEAVQQKPKAPPEKGGGPESTVDTTTSGETLTSDTTC